MINETIERVYYLPHGYCLQWKPWLVMIHAAADLLIFAAYFAIPVAIWIFIKKRRDSELKSLAILFATFILLCGITHLLALITLWRPIYELQGLVKLATAGVSLATAIEIFPLIPKAVAIQSPRQELERARDELEQRVIERTKELAAAKARFEALVQASAQVVWTRGPAGEAVEGYTSWSAFTGQSFEERQGMGWLDVIHPDDRERTAAIWQRAVRTQQIYSTEYRLRQAATGAWRWMAVKAVPLFSEGGALREWVGMNTDITDRKEAEQHLQLLMSEVNHRAKNLLAVVQAVARQTAGEENPALFAERLSERISALAASHDLLVKSEWRGVDMADLVRSQLAHFGDLIGARVVLDGPPASLKPSAAQALGMALHELATNAGKYGALSDAEGSVRIEWEIATSVGEPLFLIRWSECNGAPIEPPRRRGFGHKVMVQMVQHTLDAEVKLDYPSSGLVWELAAPAGRAVEDSSVA